MYPNGGPIHARPEEARPEAGPSSAKPSGKAPLKRGSACRRCRLRKNRCTGERPVCGLCQKDGSECVFDEAKTPRPASSSSTGRSRVSELEGKLEQLERLLTRRVAPTPSTAQPAPPSFQPPPAFPPEGQPTYIPLDQQISQFQIANPQSSFAPSTFTTAGGGGLLDSSAVPTPSPSTLVNRTGPSTAPTFPYPHHAPRSKARSDDVRREADQQAFMAEIERLFGTAASAGFAESSNGNGGLKGAEGFAPGQQQGPPAWLTAVNEWTTMPTPIETTAAGALVDGVHGLQVGGDGAGAPTSTLPGGTAPVGDEFDMWLQFQTPPAMTVSNPISPNQMNGPSEFDVALQGWVDSGKPAEALPDVVMHELLITSVHWRRQAALIISYDALATALIGPEATRPHPGLLWAMYTHASRYHSSALARSLGEDFFRIAKDHIDAGMGRQDRILDVLRGTALLAACLFTSGRFHEGFLLSGCASRLAMAAMLHRMSFPFFCAEDGQQQARWRSVPNRPAQLLPPARSMADVADRVYVFWQVTMMDRLASITTRLPACIPDDEIETPFGRAFFHSPTQDDHADVPPATVADLFADETDLHVLEASTAAPNIGAAIAQILMILSRAARLSDGISLPSRRAAYLAGPPQAMGAADTTASSDHSPESADASESFEAPCPRKGDIPPEIMQLERVLNRYVRTLPAAYIDQNSIALAVEDNGLIAPPKSGLVRSLLVLLQSQILLSFALLHEEQARYDHALYWPKCVIASRSIVQLIRTIADVDFGRLDIWMAIVWQFVAPLLVREARYQREGGNEALATSVEAEIEVLILSMRRISTAFDVPSA